MTNEVTDPVVFTITSTHGCVYDTVVDQSLADSLVLEFTNAASTNFMLDFVGRMEHIDRNVIRRVIPIENIESLSVRETNGI